MGFYMLSCLFVISVFLLVFCSILILYKKVGSGYALLVSGISEQWACNNGVLRIPFFRTVEVVDIRVRKFSTKDISTDQNVDFVTRDGCLVDLDINFYVHLSTECEILQASKMLSVNGINDYFVLKEYFNPIFMNAVKRIALEFDYNEILNEERKFRDAIASDFSDGIMGFRFYDIIIENVDKISEDSVD